MASVPNELLPFRALLRDLGQWLQAADVPGVVIGGVAVGFIGRTRVTRDVDVLIRIDDDRLPGFVSAGATLGFGPRISDPIDFAKRSHILLMRHLPTDVTLDVSLGAVPFEFEAIDRAKIISVGDFDVPVLQPEDLILMKAVAGRDRDLIDIEGIVAANSKLDKRYLRQRAQEFGAMLEDPSFVEVIERYIQPKRRRRK